MNELKVNSPCALTHATNVQIVWFVMSSTHGEVHLYVVEWGGFDKYMDI